LKIYHSIDECEEIRSPVVTIGTFDGVHLGHQEIFKVMRESASEINGETVVVTFYPHPRLVIHPDSKNLKFINTQKKKTALMAEWGIQHLVIIPFTKEFSNTPSSDFVKHYLVEKLGVKKLIIGHDHHFGKDRQGSFGELIGLAKIHGFELEEVPPQKVDGMTVSSTKIRNALIEGNVKLANKLLGYYYSLSGKVVLGNKIGRTIGFPTANIEMEDRYKLISANGVYACLAGVEGRIYKGMGNIGYRPTIDSGGLTIEVHIFNYDREIYGEEIEIFFLDRIRDEKRFDNLHELRNQLISDKAKAIDLLKIFS
jgi:riboflavin kinase/FMN adenylyltransferase